MKDNLKIKSSQISKFNEDIKNSYFRDDDFDTLSGEKLDICYFPSLVNDDYIDKLGYPGQFPYTRGIHSSLYRGKLWTMRQFAGFGSPEDTNRRFKLLLEKGTIDILK